MNKKKKMFKIGARGSLIGLILLAFYALFNFNPFQNEGKSLNLNPRDPSTMEEKDIKKEYVFQIRNKIILVNNQEKNIEELHQVFLDIKKNKGLVKLVKNGEEKTGFINEVRELLRKNSVPYSEEWESGKEPE